MTETDTNTETDTLTETPAEIKPRDVRLAAMNFLARREHLCQELKQKLQKRFPDPPLIDSVLQELENENLQSDQRYVESYIRHRSTRGYGPDRVRQELRQRGADSSLVEQEMGVAEVDWRQLARDTRLRKFGSEAPADFAERARQLRFLQYRGFGAELTQYALEDSAHQGS